MRALLLVALVACFTTPLHGFEPPRVAVYPAVIGPEVGDPRRDGFDPNDLTRQLEETLRATRLFTLFERDGQVLNESVMREQELAQSGLALGDAAEAGRLNNVGLIVQPYIAGYTYGAAFQGVDGLPGKYRRHGSGRLSVVFKVLDSTSGEVKFQRTTEARFSEPVVVVDGRTGGPARGHWSTMAAKVVDAGAKAIVNTVYPISVAQFRSGQIFVNRGEGAGLVVGQEFDLYDLGEELIDPLTGQSLGSEEFAIGRVKIVRIAPRFSVAEPVGELAYDPAPGNVLREINN